MRGIDKILQIGFRGVQHETVLDAFFYVWPRKNPNRNILYPKSEECAILYYGGL